jgi:hypothetical protein
MKVLDLDVLRPESNYVKIGGINVDVSFVPSAITWDIDQIIQELGKFNKEDVLTNSEKTKQAMVLSIKLCATFCEHKYPELNEQFFQNEVDANIIKLFVDSIKDALFKAYRGIEIPKNLSAAKRKKT